MIKRVKNVCAVLPVEISATYTSVEELATTLVDMANAKTGTIFKLPLKVLYANFKYAGGVKEAKANVNLDSLKEEITEQGRANILSSYDKSYFYFTNVSNLSKLVRKFKGKVSELKKV